MPNDIEPVDTAKTAKRPRLCQVCRTILAIVHNPRSNEMERRCACGIVAIPFDTFRVRVEEGKPVFGGTD